MMTLNGTYLTQFPNPSYYKLQSLLLFSSQKASWNFESWVVWSFGNVILIYCSQFLSVIL